MEITKTFTVAAPRSAVWSFLTDPHRVAGCLPGASITEQVDDSTYAGTMTVKVGPVTAAYKGKLHFDRLDEAAGEAELSAAAQETRGKGGADMRMKSTLAESGGATEVTVVSDVNVVGVLAQFGRGMIQDVSDQLFVRFSDCMRDQLEGESAGEADAAPAPAPEAAAPPVPERAPEPAAPTAPPAEAAPARPAPRQQEEALDVLELGGGALGRAAGRTVKRPGFWIAAAVVAFLVYWFFLR